MAWVRHTVRVRAPGTRTTAPSFKICRTVVTMAAGFLLPANKPRSCKAQDRHGAAQANQQHDS